MVFVEILGELGAARQKWTPLFGQCGSDIKVESDNIIMLPVRAA